MKIHLNREAITSAVAMCLYYEEMGIYYPSSSFGWSLKKEGNFWEVVFTYTAAVKEVVGGDSGEWLEEDVTTDLTYAIPEDCTFEDLSLMIQEALQVISKNEYKN